MNNKVLMILRKCHLSLIDDNGNKKEKATDWLISTSENNIEYLSLIVNIILNSDKISYETKLFITNNEWSMKEINEFINKLRNETQNIKKESIRPLSYNNTVLKISEDNNKLSRLISDNLIKDIIYNRIDNEEVIKNVIDTIIVEYGDCDKSRNNLLLNIDTTMSSCNSYKNNEEFFDILSSLESYLVQRKNIIESVINNNIEFVAYFNYLLNKNSLCNKEVSKDRERLLRFLNNEDYITGYVNDEQVEESEDIIEDEALIVREDEEIEKSEESTNDEDEDCEEYNVEM